LPEGHYVKLLAQKWGKFMKNLYSIINITIFILFFFITNASSYKYDQNVYDAQKILKNLGYSINKIDGKLGKNTDRVIKNFQKEYGLSVTGKLNYETMNTLNKIIKKSKDFKFTNNSRSIKVIPKNTCNSFAIADISIYENMIAVIIGIDRYQNLSVNDQLNYAAHDARGIASLLEDKYSFRKII
jgi:peptidoglycan hydrolase-like protein with peptidoglycan-binding domain